MKEIKIVLLYFLTLITTACNQSTNHKYDGSYSMNIQMFGMANSKKDLIINGNKIKYILEFGIVNNMMIRWMLKTEK